jgi:hypothetical protein
MSHASQYAEAAKPSFRQRLEVSLCAAAIAIVNEAESTPKRGARAQLAKAVLLNPAAWAATMSVGVAADGTTNDASTDAAIDARVASVWNSYLA